MLLASEHGGPKRHAFYAAIPQLGSPIGSILTAAIYLALPVLLSTEDVLAWGWRIPFLVAFPLLAVSLWLRLAGRPRRPSSSRSWPRSAASASRC